MATKFVIKNAPARLAFPTSTYPDLSDNNKTTADLQFGTVNGINSSQFIMGDLTVANKPGYGDATLVGGKLGMYINSITKGSNEGTNIPGIKVWKLNFAVGDREGGKAPDNSPGTLVTNSNVTQFCAYHQDTGADNYNYENFDGHKETDNNVKTELVQDTIIRKSGPYLSRKDGYDFGERFGKKRNAWFPIGKDKHFERYGTSDENFGERYKLSTDDGVWSLYSEKESKGWLRFNRERWNKHRVGDLEYGATGTGSGGHAQNKIRYEVTESIPRSDIGNVQRANTSNTFFDMVKEAQSFIGQDTDNTIKKIAFGDVAFSSSLVRTGGQSLHMHSVYPHRSQSASNVMYPSAKRGGTVYDGSENNQCSFVMKQIPQPTHLYSSAGTSSAPPASLSPIVDISLNIENLAPMLQRNLTTVGVTDRDYRLNRSIVITFCEEAPKSSDTLYSYLKNVTPNAADADYQGGSNGTTNTAKSLFGLAIVNHEGTYGTYKIQNEGAKSIGGSMAYTVLSYRLDDVRREVCFENAPDINHLQNFEKQWANLQFQLHPQDNGAYYVIYNPENGDMFSGNNFTGTANQPITNCKNIGNANNAGIYANNQDDWPKFMCIWVNNYQAIKGTYDDDVKLYNTDLRTSNAFNNDHEDTDTFTVLETYAVSKSSNVNSPAYLLLDGGDEIQFQNNSNSLTASSNASTLQTGIISENNNTLQNKFMKLTLNAAKEVGDNVPIYWSKDPDRQVPEPATMETSLFIDNIDLRHFNVIASNATPSGSNTVPTRLKIPKTKQLQIPGFMYTQNPTNILTNTEDHASYLVFGFDSISDFEGSAKKMLLNGFSTGADNGQIFMGNPTGIDSDTNNLRVGYTSSIENYGRQGAADSTSNRIFSASAESGTFSNAEGTPTTSFRGLNVADLGETNAEFSVVDSDAGNVDGFTQKGYVQWNFNRRKTDSGVNMDDNNGINASATSFTVESGQGDQFTANSFIEVNDGSDPETMLITKVAGDTLRVTRAQGGTSAQSHDDGANIFHVAMPEQRECVFVSARPTQVINRYTITVDNPQVFKLHNDTEFLIYIYNDSHSAPTAGFPITAKVTEISGRQISFNVPHQIIDSTDDTGNNMSKILISPKKYWLMMEIYNHADSDRSLGEPYETSAHYGAGTRLIQAEMDASTTTVTLGNTSQGNLNNSVFLVGHVIRVDDEKMLVTAKSSGADPNTLTVVRGYGDSTAAAHANKQAIFTVPRRYLPEKTYESAVMVDTTLGDSGTLGATFNESLYNDGQYINSWDLDPFIKSDNSAIKLQDYGHGDFDEEKGEGGFLDTKNLNIINDVSKYTELDIGGGITTDNMNSGDTLSFILALDDSTDAYKINVDTKHRTSPTSVSNPMYFLTEFEDELPKITDFKLQPNEKDPFLVDYTWTCGDEDVWYGFLQITDNLISHQYDGAILHLPLNDEGVDGEKVDHSADNVISAFDAEGAASSFNTSIEAAASAPSYDVEGLAGNSLKFAGNTTLLVGTENTDAGNCFSDITKEMSIVLHATHNTGSFAGGGSGNTEYLLAKRLDNGLKKSVEIFASSNGGATGHIMARVYSADLTRVELRSSTPVPKGVPMNIMLTFDANLTSQNIKLFINGKLEDVTGPVVASHSSSGTNTGWILGTNLNTGQGRLRIGSDVVSLTADGWNGKIEEVAIYNRVLYPVDVTSGKFTLTKPLKDLASDYPVTETRGISNTYNAKLFVKDYHNIRGRGKEDVACSPTASHKKAAFEVQGVLD